MTRDLLHPPKSRVTDQNYTLTVVVTVALVGLPTATFASTFVSSLSVSSFLVVLGLIADLAFFCVSFLGVMAVVSGAF